MPGDLVPIRTPTAASFSYWLLRSRPGEETIYYIGDLQRDRARAKITGTHRDPDPINRKKATGRYEDRPAPTEDPEFETVPIGHVDAVARAAWAAYEAGDVVLKQRKLGENYYQYIARRRFRGVEKEAA